METIETHDTHICHQVEQLLDNDRRTKDAVIDVSCRGGVVTLAGEVKTAEAKSAAEEIAQSATGVLMVTNELRVH